MPGEKVGNNQNQGENTNEAPNVWEQTMAEYRKAVANAEAAADAAVVAEAPELAEQATANLIKSGVDVDSMTEEELDKAQRGEIHSIIKKAEDAAWLNGDYVIGEGVAETAETKADGTARPEMRLHFDSMPGRTTVRMVQVEEVEAPQKEAVETAIEEQPGRENLDAWLESIKGTPEEYWQKLAKEKSEKGVELGEMPDLAKVDKAIANFFDNGLAGVTGEARTVREAMAKKAILNDIAKLKERGGELNDETMRNVFYGTQRMLEEMYRGNRELREDAQEPELSSDEEVAWHLKMEPRKAKMNVLLVMQQNTRRVGEGSDAYEVRLRNYAEDTPEHQDQLKKDQEYNTRHPDEAAEYAAQVLKNGQRDDLPEFKYLSWDEVNNDGVAEEVAEVEAVNVVETEKPVEREGRIKRLFEKVRGRIGFQKVVNKVMTKVAGAIVGAVAWAEGVLAEEQAKVDVDAVDANGDTLVEKVAKAEIVDVPAEVGATAAGEEMQAETEREKRLRELNVLKKETERRMARAQEQGDSAKVLHWAEMLVRINAKAAEAEAEDTEVLAA